MAKPIKITPQNYREFADKSTKILLNIAPIIEIDRYPKRVNYPIYLNQLYCGALPASLAVKEPYQTIEEVLT